MPSIAMTQSSDAASGAAETGIEHQPGRHVDVRGGEDSDRDREDRENQGDAPHPPASKPPPGALKPSNSNAGLRRSAGEG